MPQYLLVLNAGSSSAKFPVFAAGGALTLRRRDAIEGLGNGAPSFAMPEKLDVRVFTAGIAERSAHIQPNIRERLGWMCVLLGHEANAAHAPVISTAESKVIVRIIPPDEGSASLPAIRSQLPAAWAQKETSHDWRLGMTGDLT